MGSRLAIDIPALAIWPIEYLLEQEDLFQRSFTDSSLDEDYREVFAGGVCGYQLHTYLGLVNECFGSQVQSQVRDYLLMAIDNVADAGHAVNKTLELIETALESGPRILPLKHRDLEIPIEMTIALVLLLGLPNSPHYAPDNAHRFEQARRMALDVDYQFSAWLSRGREDIAASFVRLFAHIKPAPGLAGNLH